jgi:hypothetical protein
MLSKKLLATGVALAAAVFVAAAAADHGRGGDGDRDHHGRGRAVLQANLVGSMLDDQPIHDVMRGGVPWDGGARATLSRHGRFELRVRGLVVTGTGNADGVTSITASLYCAPDSDTAAAFTTQSVPLSSHGNARIRQHVTVPSRCLDPVLLVHPNGMDNRYIAASGF